MITLLLIRHATTDAVGKHLSGRAPGVLLNKEGQNQAQNLAQRLSGLPIKAIYSSPLERAFQTAEPLAQLFQLTTQINEDFIELNFGDWTNAAFTDLQNDVHFKRFNSFRSVTRIPGGELMLEAQIRMVNGLQKLCSQHPNHTVAVVSHSDLIKATIAYYAGIPLDLFQRLEISPASVSVIQIFEETARILLVNSTSEIPT
ncbi:histidine phosphatase family protein [Adhaeribacter radiodurans]|uniref:Histidine phosphatase family protein n=1 Tax=Adhaeribacter radiodurans TaxID=2745197 RepID=A0A7L7L8Q8_9BACT|nr:histidine phosphatase family protein [Adhaeribacter radiodurans]QMU29207.1 histidine phosphatase family protein [Adhaeribacter radiodurans]